MGGTGTTRSEAETDQLQLLWGLRFWGKKATCIVYRNTLEPICSTGSDTNMKRLPPLPLHVASIVLFPNCTQVGKTLRSAFCGCAAAAETQRGAGAAGGFALLTVIPRCPPARVAVPRQMGTCGLRDIGV